MVDSTFLEPHSATSVQVLACSPSFAARVMVTVTCPFPVTSVPVISAQPVLFRAMSASRSQTTRRVILCAFHDSAVLSSATIFSTAGSLASSLLRTQPDAMIMVTARYRHCIAATMCTLAAFHVASVCDEVDIAANIDKIIIPVIFFAIVLWSCRFF